MPVKRADKTPMPVREPGMRAHDFEEVNEGYCFSHAMFEAERCLRCQDPVCIDGCPVRVPIADFMHAIAAGDMHKASTILRTANPLAAICGRVCPQEAQCELQCHMTKRFGPVAIGHLERYVSDWEMEQPINDEVAKPWREEKSRSSVPGPQAWSAPVNWHAWAITSRYMRPCMPRAVCCVTAFPNSVCPMPFSTGRSLHWSVSAWNSSTT